MLLLPHMKGLSFYTFNNTVRAVFGVISPCKNTRLKLRYLLKEEALVDIGMLTLVQVAVQKRREWVQTENSKTPHSETEGRASHDLRSTVSEIRGSVTSHHINHITSNVTHLSPNWNTET